MNGHKCSWFAPLALGQYFLTKDFLGIFPLWIIMGDMLHSYTPNRTYIVTNPVCRHAPFKHSPSSYCLLTLCVCSVLSWAKVSLLEFPSPPRALWYSWLHEGMNPGGIHCLAQIAIAASESHCGNDGHFGIWGLKGSSRFWLMSLLLMRFRDTG